MTDMTKEMMSRHIKALELRIVKAMTAGDPGFECLCGMTLSTYFEDIDEEMKRHFDEAPHQKYLKIIGYGIIN